MLFHHQKLLKDNDYIYLHIIYYLFGTLMICIIIKLHHNTLSIIFHRHCSKRDNINGDHLHFIFREYDFIRYPFWRKQLSFHQGGSL